MTVGTVSRSQSVHTTTAAAPPPPPSDAAPIDMSRDVADTTPSRTSRGERTQAADAIAAPPRTFVDPQIHHAAEAFARGGFGGLDTWMQQHPVEARWILSVSRDELNAGLQADLASRPGYGGFLGEVTAFSDSRAVSDHLAEMVQPMIREAVRDVVVGRIDGMTHALESMSIDGAVTALRNAPAGSPLAALREALHMPGNSMDRERVESWVRTSLEELHALRDVAMGQTWMPNEFPASMAHVQRAMGLERATQHSIAGEAFFRGSSGVAELAHTIETGIDTIAVAGEALEMGLEVTHAVHASAEAAELAHAGLAVESAQMSAVATLATESAIAASGGVAVGIGGLAFGVMLHHQIQENRAERTEAARALGL